MSLSDQPPIQTSLETGMERPTILPTSRGGRIPLLEDLERQGKLTPLASESDQGVESPDVHVNGGDVLKGAAVFLVTDVGMSILAQKGAQLVIGEERYEEVNAAPTTAESRHSEVLTTDRIVGVEMPFWSPILGALFAGVVTARLSRNRRARKAQASLVSEES